MLCLCLASVLQLLPMLKAYDTSHLRRGGGAAAAGVAGSDAHGQQGGGGAVGADGMPVLRRDFSGSGGSSIFLPANPLPVAASSVDQQPPPTSVSSTATPSGVVAGGPASASGAVGGAGVPATSASSPAASLSPPHSSSSAASSAAHPLASARDGGGFPSSGTDSALMAQGLRLVKALRIILEAYVLFDRDGSGTIDRDEVREGGQRRRWGQVQGVRCCS